MKPADLLLHAGLSAFGTAETDALLTAARPQLRRHGIAYVRPADGRANHTIGPGTEAEAHPRLRALIRIERRRTAQRRGGRQTVLISDDELLGPALPDPAGRWFPAAAAAVSERVSGVGPARCAVLLVVDRPDRVLELSWARDVLDGGTTEFDVWRDALARHPFDPHELADRIGRLPGVDEVLLHPAAAGPTRDHGPDGWLSERLGIGRPDVGGEGAVAGGVSARGLMIATAMNRHLSTDAERRRVSDFVAAAYPGGPGDPDLFGAAERASLLGGYHAPDSPPGPSPRPPAPTSAEPWRLSPSARFFLGTDLALARARTARRVAARVWSRWWSSRRR